MKNLWTPKEKHKIFDPKKHHINDTCGNYRQYIPYRRNYTTHNDDRLLQLLRDAKEFKWQALDLTNCGLTALPDELWNLPDLKMLYLAIIA